MELNKKALLLSYFTVGYNILEGVVSIIAGILASGSIALIGFGLGLNYLYGFWQADPIVGLVIVIFLVREGFETLEEE
jgi:divalent metal cation (Fe/Co/Zn/Cd) transporter